MNVLLINPDAAHALPSEAGPTPRSGTGHYPPLGLLYLQAAAESGGDHRVEIVDMNVDGNLDPRLAARPAPGLVGISAMTPNLVTVARLIDRVKRATPAVRVAVGGPHADVFPRETAELAGVDFAVTGEAEASFSRLLSVLDRGDEPEGIPGIYSVVDEPEGDSGARPHAESLDSLPLPDRSRLRPAAYRGIAGFHGVFTTMITSRGCPHRCTFCSTPRSTYRYRAVESILEEVDRCLALGIGHVYFLDDTMPTAASRLVPLCDALTSRLPHLSWSCRTSVAGLTEQSVRAMRRAGCSRVQIGVETGTDEGLRALGKPTTVEAIRRAFGWTRRVGLETVAYLMIGIPTERSAQDVRRTIRFAREVAPDYAMFNALTLYPGTKLFEDAAASGLVSADAWRRFAESPDLSFEAPMWTRHLDRSEIHRLLRAAYRSFYWRPFYLAKQLVAGGGLRGLFRRAAAGLSMLLPAPRPTDGSAR